MDHGAIAAAHLQETATLDDQRGARRFTSLIRSAKLLSSQGEFVCVIRDVSVTGVSLKLFHGLPVDGRLALELQNGERYELTKVREGDCEASFTFVEPIAVERLIHENWNYPKRQLRLNACMPLTIATLMGTSEAVTENISQQGCRLSCEATFAIDQTVRLEAQQLPEIRAKVRWRKQDCYGLVFDNTFSLREFAIFAARLQSPGLLRGQ